VAGKLNDLLFRLKIDRLFSFLARTLHSASLSDNLSSRKSLSPQISPSQNPKTLNLSNLKLPAPMATSGSQLTAVKCNSAAT